MFRKCDTFPKLVIFISMKKIKQLRIRITEEQFEKLRNNINEETKSKSVVIRKMIDELPSNKNIVNN